MPYHSASPALKLKIITYTLIMQEIKESGSVKIVSRLDSAMDLTANQQLLKVSQAILS
jgi:hypothetical protein